METTSRKVVKPYKYIKLPFDVAPANTYFCNKIRAMEKGTIRVAPEFLTGNRTKLINYREVFLYRIMQRKFKKRLLSANRLLIIGFGCKDEEIIKVIQDNYNYGFHSTYFVGDIDNPNNTEVQDFVKEFNAIHLCDKVEETDYKQIK